MRATVGILVAALFLAITAAQVTQAILQQQHRQDSFSEQQQTLLRFATLGVRHALEDQRPDGVDEVLQELGQLFEG